MNNLKSRKGGASLRNLKRLLCLLLVLTMLPINAFASDIIVPGTAVPAQAQAVVALVQSGPRLPTSAQVCCCMSNPPSGLSRSTILTRQMWC